MTNDYAVRYWGVRIGEGGKFVEHAHKGKYIAIGWNRLGNLTWLTNEDRSLDEVWDDLYYRYKPIYGGSEIAIGIHIGVITNFVRVMKKNDLVVVPDMARGRALIGSVTGDYEYNDNWGDECSYQHRRNVQWLKEIKREEIVPKLKASLNVGLTVFSLERPKQEIMALIGDKGTGGKEQEIVVAGDELAKVIIDRLFNLAPDKFEHFITHLLTLVGFEEARTTQYVSDKGVDVIGTLNPEGLANIILKAQVKRVRGRIGNQDVLMLRGTLGADEHGVLITTGKFTGQAQAEAEAEGKKPIALIDREALIDLILEHYDELDESYKQLLSLSKREIPLRERFYTTVMRS